MSAQPGALRLARFTFPDGTTKDVLQQAWTSRIETDGEFGRCIRIETEWCDVPLWHVPYEVPR